MTMPLLIALVVALALLAAAVWHRRADLRAQQAAVVERAAMAVRSSSAAPLQVPIVDLAKCLGCGTCVRECPEDGVLALVHGQAAVVNAAACVGHARCVSECPVGAVTLGNTADAKDRDDVPALDGDLQAVGVDGMFLVGEITARSLIRVATTQGAAVARTIARRVAPQRDRAVLDVVIVGAGPGGLACALACVQHGLQAVVLDRETAIGGTVAKYPRQKLVLTDDVELPLHGRLAKREYAKEELVEMWQSLAAQHRLSFRGGVTFDRAERQADGTFVVFSDAGSLRARHVVIAVGRRGTPRRLEVPGEELPHVAYSLLDAAAFTERHCVVVGGGDSAVETALALAEQPGNEVSIVYRQDAFFRLRAKNKERLEHAVAAGRVTPVLQSRVVAIHGGHVEIEQARGGGDAAVALQLRADHVFVQAGGTPPFASLSRSGVSFAPELRAAAAPAVVPPPPPASWPVFAALAGALAALAFVLWHAGYYFAAPAVRATDPAHATLRPDHSLGLWFGIAAAGAVLANLAYLLRRQQWLGVRWGQLATWMDLHVTTGVAAVLLALLHAAMAPRATLGGYAFWSLVVLLVTGAIGRWFYAWLPRQANGRELELGAIRARLAADAPADGGDFAQQAQARVLALIERRQWRSTWFGRVLALVGLQWDLWRTLGALRRLGRDVGAGPDEVAQALVTTREAHAAAVAVAHLEDLRAMLGTWRWLHRWLALLMTLLLVAHVVIAIAHGVFRGGGA